LSLDPITTQDNKRRSETIKHKDKHKEKRKGKGKGVVLFLDGHSNHPITTITKRKERKEKEKKGKEMEREERERGMRKKKKISIRRYQTTPTKRHETPVVNVMRGFGHSLDRTKTLKNGLHGLWDGDTDLSEGIGAVPPCRVVHIVLKVCETVDDASDEGRDVGLNGLETSSTLFVESTTKDTFASISRRDDLTNNPRNGNQKFGCTTFDGRIVVLCHIRDVIKDIEKTGGLSELIFVIFEDTQQLSLESRMIVWGQFEDHSRDQLCCLNANV